MTVRATPRNAVAHDREYWDFATVLTQIGAMPHLEVAATSTP